MTQAVEAESVSNGTKAKHGVVFGWLALITALGLALRLWGITWSLPDARHPLATYHPDEVINLNAARNADLLRGDFDIEFYNYGTFYFYLVNFSHIFGRGWGLIPKTPETPGGQPAPLDVEALVRTAPENAGLFLAGRIVTALLGTGTILVLFALGNRCFGARTGLLAALFYAIAPLAVVHAHFLTVDVPVTFFVTLALLWAVRLLDSRSWKDLALAGLWVGLAAATKYNAGLVLIAPVVAVLLNWGTGADAKKLLPHLCVLLGATLLTFLIACPGIWLNWEVFWNGQPNYPGSGVRYELFEHSRQGHGEAFLHTGLGWWYHLTVSLRYGLGELLLLLSLFGLVAACIRRTRQDLVLLSFFLLYFLLAGFSAVRFARYMLPLYPVLLVWAANLFGGTETKTVPLSAATRQISAWAFGVIICLFTFMKSYSLTAAMASEDPRDRVAENLQRFAPRGAVIAFAKVPWFFSPPLSPLFGAPDPRKRAEAVNYSTRFGLRIPQTEWDVSVLEPPTEIVLLSDLEIQHAVERLRIPAAMQWMDRLRRDYYRRGNQPETFLPERNDPLYPEDLKYVVPTIWVYRRREATPLSSSIPRSETAPASSVPRLQ